jgi:hypothetical protein
MANVDFEQVGSDIKMTKYFELSRIDLVYDRDPDITWKWFEVYLSPKEQIEEYIQTMEFTVTYAGNDQDPFAILKRVLKPMNLYDDGAIKIRDNRTGNYLDWDEDCDQIDDIDRDSR